MKKTGNRILSVILTVVLLVGCIGPIGAFAAAPSYALKPQTAFKGATFAVTLTAKSIKGLQSGVVVIEYDPDVLTFKDTLSYSVTAGAIGLQSKLTKLNDTLASAPYYGGEEGKSYLSYSFMATDAALVAADITRADTSELPLAQLFFTVYSKTTAPSTELKIVEAKTEVASKISVLPETAVSVAINPMNPARSAYTYSEKNDAKQYIDTAYSGTVSGAAAFYPTVATGGLSSSAFADGADITGLTFVSPVIDKSSTKDPANPIEYPQAAFGNLTKLAAVNVNVTKSQLSSSRFFTDDGIIYIRDVDAKGKLQNTCKVYLIPYAHAADVYLSNNVTGIFDDGTGVFGSGALCGKTKDDFTFHHKTHCDGDSEITTAPTCEGTGVRTYYCAFCAGKTKVTRTETVAATGHKWGAWTETKAPTCEGKGSEKRVCKNDKSHFQTRDVNPTGHAWGEWKVKTPPTCTEEGVETRVCKNDKSHTETRPVSALGHDFGEWTLTKAPTCIEEGVETRVCGNDNSHTETRPVAALGHEFGEWKVTKAPTCEEPGVETRYCAHNKKHTETRPVAPIGHAWGEWTVTKAPTCETPGVETRVCLNDETHTETREVAAIGHAWGEWQTVTEPTCTEPGSQIRYCEHNKKHTETQEIPALGHTWENEEVLKSATCREEGLKHHDCAVCGFEEDYAYNDSDAHIWVENGTNFWGTPKWKCSVCGEEKTQRDKPGSTYVEITTEPPVTEPPTTEAPTTEAPTTEVPTTEAPTTEAPTTEAPTTEAPTTEPPTTEPPVTQPTTPSVPSTDPTVPSTPDTTAPQGREYLVGDVDFNGKTNAKDARLVLRYAAKIEEFSELQIKVADADSNGKTNAKDARLVLRAAAKIEALSPETIMLPV